MKVLVIDPNGLLLDFCMRGKADGHEMRWWIPNMPDGKRCCVGDGYIDKVTNFHTSMKWADLIVTGDNSAYSREYLPYFKKGFPMFGCNEKGAELEIDRGAGQELCKEYGIETVPYQIFTSYDDAISYVEKTMGTYVSKPWGDTADKDLSYVSGSPEDMVYKLLQWKGMGRLKGQIMLQDRVKGIEMAVGGWFGKGGWSQWLCENFEEKKFMNDALGKNTGEQGTILRYVKQSKLFDEVLEPVTGYLHEIGYCGYVDMNTMVRGKRAAAPLEFTMRFGYPLRDIQSALHKGDSINWMHDLLHGKDTLQVIDDISVGVVLTHGTYPNDKRAQPEGAGVPLYGITQAMEPHLHFNEVSWGCAPMTVGGKIRREVPMPITAGDFLMTVTGTGSTVSEAQEKAYNTIWKIKPPTNRMFRTDIGDRLKSQLPELQSNGYAEGMKF